MWVGFSKDELELIKGTLNATMSSFAPAQAIVGIIDEALKRDAAEDEPWVDKARELHGSDGNLEVDPGAVVSHGEDAGAYVMAWIWVTNEDMGIEDEDEDDG